MVIVEGKKAAIDLEALSEEALLQVRICDLPIRIAGTWLESCIQDLHAELSEKDIAFHPQCYLAEEWLTPVDEPIIGIPFYLAHPVLTRLEKRMMLEAEGEGRDLCMKLLRHEAGHALSYAYRLHRKRSWKAVFGDPSQEYGDTYRFRPYSKNFVRHLDYHYAQFHPDEDFVETFAVWLTPDSDWRTTYAGWGALKKLEYVDKLMSAIRGKSPLRERGRPLWKHTALRSTLRSFYKRKRHLHAEYFPDFHDPNLCRIFIERTAEQKDLPLASQIIQRNRRALLSAVSSWTGERKYVIDNQLKMIADRCRRLKLASADSEAQVIAKLTAYLTTLIMNYRYTGRFRGQKHRQ